MLAKPERFNPPSHGARLPRKGGALPRHYGGELSSDEVQRQRAKDYPGLPPPPGTWGQWFWNSRGLHMAITLGTLTSLAVYTFTENFKRTSPFVDLLPTYSDMAAHPIASTRQVIEVVRMNAMHRAAETDRKRKRHVEDVEKRKLYRQAHGLPEEQGFFGLKQATIRTDAEMAAEAAARAHAEALSASPVRPDTDEQVLPPPAATKDGVASSSAAAPQQGEPRKKWLGIF